MYSMRALIFDIDGTLVESMDFDSSLYRQALRQVLGGVFIHEEWIHYSNVTDSGILWEIMSENGFHDQKQYQAVRNIFGVLVEDYLKKNRLHPLPGALELFQQIRTDRHRHLLGLATGGWSHTARFKLDAAGFPHTSIPLTSSDDAMDRTGIMRLCLAKLGTEFERVHYIGDGEWDLQATAALGWDFIGVGPKLEGKCRKWLPDFQNHSRFFDLMNME